MAKTYDFVEFKAGKEGKITPKAVVESVNEWIDNNPNKIQKIAIVVILEDGTINTAMSTMSYLEVIGLFATAQAISNEEMDE